MQTLMRTLHLALLMLVVAGCSATRAPEELKPMVSTFYVSKLGDNTDGSTWPKAFTTIQAALNAVPDSTGNHRIVIRPDIYMESNLYSTHKGAAGAYNSIVGDFEGKLGSGATGWVV